MPHPGYQPFGEPLLAAIVERMRQAGKPRKIVLFGSRATRDSDIDLLVVETTELPRYKRAARYRKAIAGLFPAKDIVVWAPAEIEEWRSVPNAFITTALREGRVIYEA